MADEEWTGSMSYAHDIMASRSRSQMWLGRPPASAPASQANAAMSVGRTNAEAAASARTLPGCAVDGHEKAASSMHGAPSEQTAFNGAGDGMPPAEKPRPVHETVEDVEITRSRRVWTFVTWALTWWIPSPLLSWCGRMKRPDVRMAWREKVAICVIIFFIWCVLLFIIIGLGLILCPKEHVWTMDDIASHDSPEDSYVALRGRVYDITEYVNQKHGTGGYRATKDQMLLYAGQDINASFPLAVRTACPALVGPKADPKYSMYLSVADINAQTVFPFMHKVGILASSAELSDQSFYAKYVLPTMSMFKRGDVVWGMDWIKSMHKDQGKYWRVINREVFSLDDYFATIQSPSSGDAEDWRFLNSHIENMFDDKGGGETDVTDRWNKIPWSARDRLANYSCMKNLFYVGKVDDRRSVRCLFTNYMLLAFACVLMAIVLVKFLAALQLSTKKRPLTPNKYVVCQVPCYTEGEASLAKTIDSLAALDYDDNKKLIFVICDGNIVGSGNDRPTPRIVLDILGVDPEYDPPGRDYLAIAEGSRRHNIGKIYSGLYEHEGHTVPFMVAVKVGTPDEANRSGNRGKRDSQIMLMAFFNKVHFDLPMTPLELEMYHQMRHIIGMDPAAFEYILQVDADTEVLPDSLPRLIAACSSDQRIAGICGETMLGNEGKSWTTMMQVYEYFISHHMAKAFESLFGAVTCLPGCFCMYRLRSAEGKPLLVAKPVLEAYSELHVDTLHKKNLLSLGEDRYLTTLMMKHFPQYKLKFVQDAKCRTIAPEKWAVLVSQRRRWINSTIHNLAELMFLPDMCGFCCFSMRFVVFLDLFGTITMPCTLFYFAYLVYVAVTKIADVGYISLILIGAIYGVQAIIFILRREWQHIGWMLIYLLAYPLWSFILPIYSFWHMDDFSWGNTRVVVGDGKRKLIIQDDKPFDPASIPQRRWREYEADLNAAGVLNAPPPNMNPNADSSRDDERMSVYSRKSMAMLSHYRAGSMYGYSRAPSVMGGSASDHYTVTQAEVPGTYAPVADPRYSMISQPAVPLQYALHGRGSAAGEYPSHEGAAALGAAGAGVPLATIRSQSPAAVANRPHTLLATSAPSQIMAGAYDHGAGPVAAGSGTALDAHHHRPTSLYTVGGQAGGTPSDSQIIDATRRILAASDLRVTTKKKIRQQLAHEFGVDLAGRKDFISSVIDRILSGQM
ncbi:hypothetical protein H4R18_000700 [Coemansia javaensis]|uniref:chitin synthase n=1 Tax=Coemansia javaensis TaxID=2761396 RepID=A0A9W8LLA8_9FUNG|nr:hypothetical protein H4R18_000700 [Coemansia javaensis]